MRKIVNLFSFAMLFMFVNMMSFATEAKSALKASGTDGAFTGIDGFTIEAPDKDDGMAAAFSPLINFMLKFRTVIMIVFAVVAVVLFFAGVFKFLGNPELSQIINYVVSFAFVLVLAFAFYKFIDKLAGAELPVELLKAKANIVQLK